MMKQVKYGYDEDGEFEITVTLMSDDNNPLDSTSIYLSRKMAQHFVSTQMKYGIRGQMMTRDDEAVKKPTQDERPDHEDRMSRFMD